MGFGVGEDGGKIEEGRHRKCIEEGQSYVLVEAPGRRVVGGDSVPLPSPAVAVAVAAVSEVVEIDVRVYHRTTPYRFPSTQVDPSIPSLSVSPRFHYHHRKSHPEQDVEGDSH